MKNQKKFDFRIIIDILESLKEDIRRGIFCIGGSSMAINPIFDKDLTVTEDMDLVVKKYEDFSKIIKSLKQVFPQIELPDDELDVVLKRGVPYTLILDDFKIDLFGKKILGVNFTESMEKRSKSRTFASKKGPVSINYISDNDLLLFKLFASLNSTIHFDHAIKILQNSKEIDWQTIFAEAKLQDSINVEEEKNLKFKTPSIYSIILELISDLKKLGFKIRINITEPAL